MQFKFSFAGVALAALVSTAACQNCPGDDGLTINSARGDEYQIACNTTFGGRIDALNVNPNTFGTCIDFCSEYTAYPSNLECVGVEYWAEGPNQGQACNGPDGYCSCYIHSSSSDIQSSVFLDSAFLRKLASSSSSSVTTTTTTISPSSTILTTTTIGPSSTTLTTTTTTISPLSTILTTTTIDPSSTTLTTTTTTISPSSTTLTTTSIPTATPTSSCSTPCKPNALCCDDSEHFSYCVSEADGSTKNVYFGDVAPGTYCDAVENRIRADNEGNCSPDGMLQCGNDGETFMECDQGGLINFGSVAAGTMCENGAILAV